MSSQRFHQGTDVHRRGHYRDVLWNRFLASPHPASLPFDSFSELNPRSFHPIGPTALVSLPREHGQRVSVVITRIHFFLSADGVLVAAGHHADEITLELTRIVIALSVFAVGVELPK